MKIFLARKVQLQLSQVPESHQVNMETDSGMQRNTSVVRLVNLRRASIPVNFSPENVLYHEDVTKLKEKLTQVFSSDPNYSRLPEREKASWKIEILIGVYVSSPDHSSATNSSDLKGYIEVFDSFTTRDVLKRLRQIYGDALKLTVLVENFSDTQLQSGSTVPSKQMSLTEKDIVEYTLPDPPYSLEKSELPVTGNIRIDEWIHSTDKRTRAGKYCRWQACVTIFAEVPDNKLTQPMRDIWSINKKLLLDQLFTDTRLVAQNGVGVKCHKSFLSAHSPVLATMFQTAMQESQTSTVEMPDMGEASVRAFLEFLYCLETKEAESNSLICFELFAAGHKYAVSQLEHRMEEILMVKNDDWYEVDVAMKLFLFSGNLSNGDKLKMKALKVLKTKQTDLENSAICEKLLKDDPKAAINLCVNAFRV